MKLKFTCIFLFSLVANSCNNSSKPNALTDEFVVNKVTTSCNCRVQNVNERPQIGARHLGPFKFKSEAIKAMCENLDPNMEDQKKCWTTTPKDECITSHNSGQLQSFNSVFADTPKDTLKIEGPSISEIERGIKMKNFEGLRDYKIDSVQLLAPGNSYPMATSNLKYRGWYPNGSANTSTWAPKWSKFNAKRPSRPDHKGADLSSIESQQLIAIVDGTIEYNPIINQDWGNIIYLYFKVNGIKYIAVYAHIDAVSKFSGSKSVKFADPIGKAGCSGNAGEQDSCDRSHECDGRIAKADHLHLELLELTNTGGVKDKIDPVKFFGWAVKHENENRVAICPTWAEFD